MRRAPPIPVPPVSGAVVVPPASDRGSGLKSGLVVLGLILAALMRATGTNPQAGFYRVVHGLSHLLLVIAVALMIGRAITKRPVLGWRS